MFVDTYGTGVKPDREILAAVKKAFDFRPGKKCNHLEAFIAEVLK